MSKNVALGVASYINIFNSRNGVIGEGISNTRDFFIDKMKENVQLYALKKGMGNVIIERAILGNSAGLVCAIIY
jgi:glucokinase